MTISVYFDSIKEPKSRLICVSPSLPEHLECFREEILAQNELYSFGQEEKIHDIIYKIGDIY